MDALEFFLLQHARLHSADVAEAEGGSFADRVFGGLTDHQLRLRPAKGLNSLAWLLWHMARAEDATVSLVTAAEPQVLDDGWLRRLAVSRRDIGTGMTDAEVAELSERIDLAAVRAYRSAVGRRTREIAARLPPARWAEAIAPADTERMLAQGALSPKAEFVAKVFQKRTRGGLLGSIAITHTATHLGEATCVRSQAGLGLGV